MYESEPKYVESCAYHEAAHTVIAVALGIPLRTRGVHIDTLGNGYSYYWFRNVGNLSNTAADIDERERTIIAGEAAFIAQVKFYPECLADGNRFDRLQTTQLLNEMYPNTDQFLAEQSRLVDEARRLVDLHWNAIDALAKEILAQPLTPLPDSEKHWSTDTQERWVDANRVVSILKTFAGLQPVIRP
jgi:hypothetical protein